MLFENNLTKSINGSNLVSDFSDKKDYSMVHKSLKQLPEKKIEEDIDTMRNPNSGVESGSGCNSNSANSPRTQRSTCVKKSTEGGKRGSKPDPFTKYIPLQTKEFNAIESIPE
jgi:hypothetical protein